MKVYSNYFVGDPSFLGALSVFSGISTIGSQVTLYIENERKIETYQNYYDAISQYFDGVWRQPVFAHERDSDVTEDDLEIPIQLILENFIKDIRKPLRILPTEDMICYSFITVQDAQGSKNRTLNKNDVFTLVDYLDGYDLGDTRDMEADVIIRKLDAIQKSKLYIGSPCAWAHIAQVVFSKPTMWVYPNKFKEHNRKDGDGKYKYFEEQWYKYGRS